MASIQTAGGTVSGSAQEIIVTAATAVAVVAVLYWLLKREVKAGADAVGDALKKGSDYVNPTSDKNVAYKLANLPAKLVAWDKDATVGTVAADVADELKTLYNPASQENYANKGVTAVVRGVTGDSNATLGTKIYDGVEWLKNVF